MPTSEYEVRLYEPESRRPLYFTRAVSAAAAQSLARRWQAARPECRVRVVVTSAPRPAALAVA
jgi:hypothetical protein